VSEKPHLEVVHGSAAATFPLAEETQTVGRSRECDIALRDRSISRVHAEIRHENGHYVIEDQGGLNGVFVDGVRTERARLRDGAMIQLGRVTLRFVEVGSESSTTQRIQRPPTAGPAGPTEAEQVLDQLAFGVVFLSGSGTVAFTNRTARAIIERGDGLILAGGALRATDASVRRALRSLIEQVTVARRGGALAIPRSSNDRPLAALATPLSAGGSSGATAALFLTDPDLGAGSCEEVMTSLYGLTPAEARLTAELMQGKSLDEAAAALAISIHTARSHLKRVFAKTGTRRQSELVRLLVSTPAQLHGV
jgi:DNA-binding CsgD family transcriptional regulator